MSSSPATAASSSSRISSDVWVDLHVYRRTSRRLRIGQRVIDRRRGRSRVRSRRESTTSRRSARSNTQTSAGTRRAAEPRAPLAAGTVRHRERRTSSASKVPVAVRDERAAADARPGRRVPRGRRELRGAARRDRPARRDLDGGDRRARRRPALRRRREASSSRPTSGSPAPATTTEERDVLERILRLLDPRSAGLVLVVTAAVAAFGAWNFTRLPIDAVPDITNVQVQINTEAPGCRRSRSSSGSPSRSRPAMAGIPRVEYTRSLSRYGLSQVTVIFEDGTDIYFARQLVNERAAGGEGSCPPGVEPRLGPISTGLGEIFMSRSSAARRTKPDGSPTRRSICARSRTGSSSRSCAPCRASPR